MADDKPAVSLEPQPGLRTALEQGFRETAGLLHPAFGGLLEMIWRNIQGMDPDGVSEAASLFVRGGLARLVDVSRIIGTIQNRVEPERATQFEAAANAELGGLIIDALIGIRLEAMRDFQSALNRTADRLNLSATSTRRMEVEQANIRHQQELERKANGLKVEEIVNLCGLLGVKLERDSDQSVVARPSGRLNGELREIVKLRRQDLIEYLRELSTAENL